MGTASVNWTEINGISKYLIDVEFPLVDGGGNWNKFSFEVANGTCSNDGQGGSVEFQFGSPTPLPSTLLLLGGGLLALVGLGRRVRKNEIIVRAVKGKHKTSSGIRFIYHRKGGSQ